MASARSREARLRHVDRVATSRGSRDSRSTPGRVERGAGQRTLSSHSVQGSSARFSGRSGQHASPLPQKRQPSSENPAVTRVPSWSHHWSVEEVEQLVQEKVLAVSARSNDQLRESFEALHGSARDGISRSAFRRMLRVRFGIPLTDEQAEAVFRHYDPDNTGHITFHAFVSRVMPRDYSEPTYWDRRADEIVRSVVHKPLPSSPHLERPQRVYPAVSPDELRHLVLDKIMCRARSGADMLRVASRVLGFSVHAEVGPADLARAIVPLGLPVSDEDVAALLVHYCGAAPAKPTATLRQFVYGLAGHQANSGTAYMLRRQGDMVAQSVEKGSAPLHWAGLTALDWEQRGQPSHGVRRPRRGYYAQ